MQPKFRVLTEVITVPVAKDETGMPSRRIIGNEDDKFDPFLLMDHIGPVVYGPGEAVGAPDHPHRGLQVLSYVIEGGVMHRDNLGNCGTIRAGGIQLLSCARGLVHYEMPCETVFRDGGQMEGFQIWINMPSSAKMNEPWCQEIKAADVPTVKTEDNGAEIKVICGEVFGISGAVEPNIPVQLLDITLRAPLAAVSLDLPEQLTCALVYVWQVTGSSEQSGLEVLMDDLPGSADQVFELIRAGQSGLLSAGSLIRMRASASCTTCRCLIVAGKAIGEPVVKLGPFAMTTQEEIDQALTDYHSGLMGTLPGTQERIRQNEAAIALSRLRNRDHASTNTGDDDDPTDPASTSGGGHPGNSADGYHGD